MRKHYHPNYIFILFTMLISLNIFSCSTKRSIKYFQDIPDSGSVFLVKKTPFIEPLIQPDNILSVIVQTVDVAATQTVNEGNVSSPSVGANGLTSVGQQTVSGYLVDKDGFIALPVLGRIKVVGLTTSQCKDLITSYAAKFYKDPIIYVRFANFTINVLGEVSRPGVYVVPNERVTVLDALGLAGDLTIYGKRDNILLLREKDGSDREEVVRLDLTKSNIINSPYFYLRPNDKLYVEPSKSKIVSSDATQTRNITIGVSILSLLIVLISRL